MTNRCRPKPNGRSWLTSCDWIRRVQKVETHHQSPVMGFTQSKRNEGSIPFARSNLKIVNGIKLLAIFEFYENPK